jgi:hypothetical protein
LLRQIDGGVLFALFLLLIRIVSYFHGKMGAGKSSIARLVDYCLGGDLEYTPALQSEFVAATLHISVNDTNLVLERLAQANQIHAQWGTEKDAVNVAIPARTPGGEVIQGTGVEVISDLLFYLSGIRPPKVRRSKLKEDSELARLSFRDLMWYCYLDQDTIDSSFFNLDAEANTFKRLKSRDVLRFVVGFHQERVAELEARLEDVRTERLRMSEGAQALKEALESAGIENEIAIQAKLGAIQNEISDIAAKLEAARASTDRLRTHAVDDLRRRGRTVAHELEAVENAIRDVEEVIAEDRRQLNELTTLKLKFRRVLAARSVLNGVAFGACPRCAQPLPERVEAVCRVCGQPDSDVQAGQDELEVTEKDADARIKELSETLRRQEAQLKNLRRRQAELAQAKGRVDSELDHEMSRYDSAYLSSALTLEQRRAALEQQSLELDKLRVLPQKVSEQLARADQLGNEEKQLRRELIEARQAAERDTKNLRRLEELFLDCLVRSRIPGFTLRDEVQIRSPQFLPEVMTPETGDMIVTSFANLGSGGKKTLFKCCFAVAMHRLAVEIGALLPTFLMIDSPMKNISERENREQFEGFHHLLYELAADGLRGTQLILIDKEFYKPAPELKLDFIARHMQPEGLTDLPLISYYKGH